MARMIEGNLDARGLKFAIIAARFNSFIVERLLEGALDALRRTGADTESVAIVKVPGSWEMPVVAAELARQKRYDGIICLGAVIRGETPHFDYVAGNAASGLAGIPRANRCADRIRRADDEYGGASGGPRGSESRQQRLRCGNDSDRDGATSAQAAERIDGMSSRRTSRHRAVQVLYQCDMRALPADQAISAFYGGLYSEENPEEPESDPFMEALVTGPIEKKADIDERLVKYSERWRIERMPAVDRNILRMAIFRNDAGRDSAGGRHR